MSLEVADDSLRPLLEGLAQFYVYDFSELDPPESSRFEFGDDGLFTPLPWFEKFWGKPCTAALVVRFDGRPAGFVLIDTISHADGRAIDHNMGEYFIARQYRGGGIAVEILRQVLAIYPGYWEFAVMESNLRAKAFWPKAIKSAPNVSDVRCVEGDGEHWTGPIWSCVAA